MNLIQIFLSGSIVGAIGCLYVRSKIVVEKSESLQEIVLQDFLNPKTIVLACVVSLKPSSIENFF